MIDTDYEQYAILRLSLRWQGKDYHVLKYFSKCMPGSGAGPAAAPLGTAQPSPAHPVPPAARSLEDEYGPGFRRFRDLTADMGLYLVARHGEPQAFWVGARLGTLRAGRGPRGLSGRTSRRPVPQGDAPSS